MLYISELPFSKINLELMLCSLRTILVTLVRSSAFARNTRFISSFSGLRFAQ